MTYRITPIVVSKSNVRKGNGLGMCFQWSDRFD